MGSTPSTPRLQKLEGSSCAARAHTSSHAPTRPHTPPPALTPLSPPCSAGQLLDARHGERAGGGGRAAGGAAPRLLQHPQGGLTGARRTLTLTLTPTPTPTLTLAQASSCASSAAAGSAASVAPQPDPPRRRRRRHRPSHRRCRRRRRRWCRRRRRLAPSGREGRTTTLPASRRSRRRRPRPRERRPCGFGRAATCMRGLLARLCEIYLSSHVGGRWACCFFYQYFNLLSAAGSALGCPESPACPAPQSPEP